MKAEDAGGVRPGNTVLVKAAGRQATARVTCVSPALDPQTRLVPALATLDNRGGEWRVGEPVTAAVQLTGSGGSGAIRVPTTAVQSFEGKSVVFVRTPRSEERRVGKEGVRTCRSRCARRHRQKKKKQKKKIT